QTLADPSRTIEVLCAMLKTVGAIEPESTLVLKYLRRATKRDEHALETLIRLVIERQEGAIGCGYRLLPALGVKAQARLGHALAKELFQRDVRDHPTEAIALALQQLRHRDATSPVVREVLRQLNSPEGLRVR